MTKKNNNKSAIRTDKDKKVARKNRAIYSATDPTTAYPSGIGLVSIPLRAGAALFNPDEMQYEVTDSVADAAWRKRLGLSYDDKFLIKNKNGSYRLPRNVEREIPTDTTFIKNRIAANEKLANQSNIMGEDWKLVDSMIDLDKKTLDALRKTYKTGKPVVINEYSNNSRKLAKDGELVEGAHDYKTPLNVLQNYTIQYDPLTNTMKYRDTYDFNGFESFVPGEPFDIEGEIPLRKYSLGSWLSNIGTKLDGWNSNLTDKFLDSDLGKGLSSFGIKSGGIGGIANTATTAIGGLLAGKNKTGVGSAMQTVGSLASNIPGVGGLIGAGVNLVGGLVNAAFGSNINKEFVNQTEAQARQQANYVSGATDNDSLLSDWSNFSFLKHVNKHDVGSDGWFSDDAKDKTNELNSEIDIANNRALASLGNTALNIDKQKDLMLMANYNAYGGPLDMKYTGVMSPFGNQFKDGGIYIKPSKSNKYSLGGDFSNGVVQINAGGLHSTNPYEGVQMGIDPQGIPNLVEEGEVIYDDYVFSNRLRVPKEVRQKYKLRGVTFADAAKQLQKESEERPNDPISKNGLNADMAMLQQEQETVRMKKESNKYAKGGKLCNKFLLGGTPVIDNPYSPYSSSDGDYSRWFTLDPNNSSKVTSYSDPYKNLVFTADMARAYAKNNPNDESLKSFLSRGNKLESLTDEDVQKGSLDTNFGWLHKARAMMANLDNANTIDVDSIFKGLSNTPFKPLPIKSVPKEKVKEIAPMQDNWLRKLPVWMSGVAVANDLFGGNEPNYSNSNIFQRAIEGTYRPIRGRQIGNYLRYTPFDRDFYINKLNADASATRRGIMNTSGGNRAAAMAGLLAADYNYGNQLGALARQAEEYNLAQRQAVEEFNRGTNMTNAEMATKADMANAEQAMQRARMYGSLAEYRDKILAANRAEKSANLTNFIQGLGDLGRELTDRDMLRWLADLGVFTYNPNGIYTGTKKSKGGRINRKKRGGFTI